MAQAADMSLGKLAAETEVRVGEPGEGPARQKTALFAGGEAWGGSPERARLRGPFLEQQTAQACLDLGLCEEAEEKSGYFHSS